DIFERQMLTRAPSIFDTALWARATETIGRKITQIGRESRAKISEKHMTGERVPLILFGALFTIGALILIFRAKRAAESWLISRLGEGEKPAHGVTIAVCLTIARLLLPAVAVTLVMAWLFTADILGTYGFRLMEGFAHTAMVVIGAYGLGGAFFAPHEPRLRISRFDDRCSRIAHYWLMAVAMIAGLDSALVQDGTEGLGLSFEALLLINSVLIIPGGIALYMLATTLKPERAEAPEPGEEDLAPYQIWLRTLITARFIARVVAVLAPVLALGGYYFASRFVFYPFLFSGASVGLAVLLFYMVREVVEQMTGQEKTGQEKGEGPQRLRLIPVFVGFLLSCVLLPVLALIWGASPADLAASWRVISDGFVVGDVTLSPVDGLSLLLVFAIGYVITRMIQGVLARNVLPLTGLDTGGRDAMTAGVGYLGVFISALIAISATGLDLSNLAIVAGALSVGIGFGLQNIVNNFVSGIILLIERPIKTGDWVEIGGIHGTVRKVNVRSTLIETFDRSTMFVPNADLISSSVTNWTHGNLNGRIIVKVGVAYGTDPRKVEKILQGIADGHPMLLKRPSPYVLFRGFGADSLDFEIRGVLRDVNWILNVSSDLNYEISRRFTEEGIEIPFAQRDVTIKNISDMGEGFARVVADLGDYEGPRPHKAMHQPASGLDIDAAE
ncbi:MAG: mechanosensitive ion channel domain-containing protein, partial [Pseudomonadota bacterium]